MSYASIPPAEAHASCCTIGSHSCPDSLGSLCEDHRPPHPAGLSLSSPGSHDNCLEPPPPPPPSLPTSPAHPLGPAWTVPSGHIRDPFVGRSSGARALRAVTLPGSQPTLSGCGRVGHTWGCSSRWHGEEVGSGGSWGQAAWPCVLRWLGQVGAGSISRRSSCVGSPLTAGCFSPNKFLVPAPLFNSKDDLFSNHSAPCSRNRSGRSHWFSYGHLMCPCDVP